MLMLIISGITCVDQLAIKSLMIPKDRRHHRMVRLFVQSLPSQAQEIQPAKAGFVQFAPGFQPAGGLAGKEQRE